MTQTAQQAPGLGATQDEHIAQVAQALGITEPNGGYRVALGEVLQRVFDAGRQHQVGIWESNAAYRAQRRSPRSRPQRPSHSWIGEGRTESPLIVGHGGRRFLLARYALD